MSSLTSIAGQPSWQLSNTDVTLAVTRTGGQMGPVTFRLGRKEVCPFSVAPWAEEDLPRSVPPLLRALRGDFFCAPFGAGVTPFRGEYHPPHGDTANLNWKRFGESHGEGRHVLQLELETKTRPGHVLKTLEIRNGQTNIYIRHDLSGWAGPMSFGHHAMLHFKEPGLVSTSPLLYGQVLPDPFENPENGGYQSLRPGSRFVSLEAVERLDGSTADLSQYPARRGFEDLVITVHEAAPDFAWTAVVFAKSRYVWFSLKDPRLLRSTVFWISNGGRHYAPWNGRHTSVLGLEDVTSYFHCGLHASARPNPLSRAGFPTALTLRPDRPLAIPYILGVAATPAGFKKVSSIERTAGGIVLTSTNCRKTFVPVDTSFLAAPCP